MNYVDKGESKQFEVANSKSNGIFHTDSVFTFVCPPCKLIPRSPNDDQLKQLDENSATISNQSQLIGNLQSRVSSLEFVIADMKTILSNQLLSGNRIITQFNQCVSDLGKNMESLEIAQESLDGIDSSSSQRDNSKETADTQQTNSDGVPGSTPKRANENDCNINCNSQLPDGFERAGTSQHFQADTTKGIPVESLLRPPQKKNTKNQVVPLISINCTKYSSQNLQLMSR